MDSVKYSHLFNQYSFIGAEKLYVGPRSGSQHLRRWKICPGEWVHNKAESKEKEAM